MASRIKSSDRMSNSGYHRSGKPCWWARIGSGKAAQWLKLGQVRGDQYLDVIVDVEPGTVVHVGVGRGRDGVRERVRTEAAS